MYGRGLAAEGSAHLQEHHRLEDDSQLQLKMQVASEQLQSAELYLQLLQVEVKAASSRQELYAQLLGGSGFPPELQAKACIDAEGAAKMAAGLKALLHEVGQCGMV